MTDAKITDTHPQSLSGELDRMAQSARRHIASASPVSLDALAGWHLKFVCLSDMARRLEGLTERQNSQIHEQALVYERLATECAQWEAHAHRADRRARDFAAQFEELEAVARDIDPTHIGLFDHARTGPMELVRIHASQGHCAEAGEVIHPRDSGQVLDLSEVLRREQRDIQAALDRGYDRIAQITAREAEINSAKPAPGTSLCGNDRVVFPRFGRDASGTNRVLIQCGGPQDGDAA